MKKVILFSLITLIFSNSYSQVNIDSGLVANYQFSGNANDSSIYLNNGIVNGAVLTTDRNDNENSAYYFDGIDDYIEVDANSNLSASNYQLSISLWVNIKTYDTSQNKQAYILDKTVDDGYSSDWGVKYFDRDQNPAIEQLRFCGPLFTPWGNGGGTNTITGYWSSTIPILNTWYHIVINHDLDNNQEIFINGVSESIVGNGGNSTSFWENTAKLIIGKATDNSSFFHGTIDDIRIYNRILTNDEIDFLFDETTTLSIDNYNNSKDLKFYPNPCGDFIFIMNEKLQEISTYEIFDTMGKTIISRNFTKNKIDTSDLISGVYFIKLENKKGDIFTRKIIKN